MKNIFFIFLFFSLTFSITQQDMQPFLSSNQIFQNIHFRPVASNITSDTASNGLFFVEYKTKPLFLINVSKDISFVSDYSLISDYYNKTYVQPHVQELYMLLNRSKKALFFLNKSRNAPSQLGPIEQVCKKNVWVNNTPCFDKDQCYKDAVAVCGGSSSCAVMLSKPLLDFNLAIDSFDKAVNSFLAINQSTNISEIQTIYNQTLAIVEQDMQILQTSILRYPRGKSTNCINCMGYCPEYLFNYTAFLKFKNLNNKLNTQQSFILIFNSQNIIDSIYQNNLKYVRDQHQDIEQNLSLNNQDLTLLIKATEFNIQAQSLYNQYLNKPTQQIINKIISFNKKCKNLILNRQKYLNLSEDICSEQAINVKKALKKAETTCDMSDLQIYKQQYNACISNTDSQQDLFLLPIIIFLIVIMAVYLFKRFKRT